MKLDRTIAARYGHEAVAIIGAGSYRSPSGRIVGIAGDLRRAVEGTRSYPPDVKLAGYAERRFDTRIEVENQTTLAAARRMREAGLRVAALNFASATSPGGGFLNGARAQEESLAWSSGLHACLRGNPMYAYHQAQRDPLYSNYAIYSPDVPVFRADDGTLLGTPYAVSMITAPAVNASRLDKGRLGEAGPAMRERILKVLEVGVMHGHEAIVLGAWGCGAFGNDSRDIAPLFHEALKGPFSGAYRQVVFAITDWSPEERFIGPFREVFS